MNRPPSSGRRTRDRGSVAVEFALVLPVLLLIVFGIIDFGRALNAQIELTGAAREGAQAGGFGLPRRRHPGPRCGNSVRPERGYGNGRGDLPARRWAGR